MPLAMPIVPVKLPSTVKDELNGQVDPALLWTVEQSKTSIVWRMAEYPARSMRAWHAAAISAGIVLTSTGRGRTYTQQVILFLDRYSLIRTIFRYDIFSRPVYVTKYWPGHGLYYQKPGTSAAAVPGTSNHGWWCADDMAEIVDGLLIPLRASTLQWLYATGKLYGFGWETTDEPWHVHWVMGDLLPQRVLEFERPWLPPVPTPTPPPVDSELMVTIYKLRDAAAQFVALTANGVALQVEWTGSGADPRVQERLSILRQFGAQEITVNVADISRCTLLGPLPEGDPYHNWQSSDFLKHIQ